MKGSNVFMYWSLDNMTCRCIEVNVRDLQYGDLNALHIIFTGEVHSENLLKEGDVGYDELAVFLSESIEYCVDNFPAEHINTLGRNFFNTDVFLTECKARGIKAIESKVDLDTVEYTTYDNFTRLDLAYDMVLSRITEKPLFYHYKGNKLTLLFYNDNIKFTGY